VPNAFEVVLVGDRVGLDYERRGRATFTAINRSGRALRGRAEVDLDVSNPAEAGWFNAVDPDFDFAAGAEHDYEVDVAVPRDVPPGDYGFVLKVVGEQNPDEYYGFSPEVSVKVEEWGKRPFPWWLLGAAVGMLGLGFVVNFFFNVFFSIPAVGAGLLFGRVVTLRVQPKPFPLPDWLFVLIPGALVAVGALVAEFVS
jgi:hypothetical protein